MKAVHFNAKTGQEIPAHEIGSGVTGFTSWRRLVEIFAAAGELRPNEDLLSFQVDDRGISFRVTIKDSANDRVTKARSTPRSPRGQTRGTAPAQTSGKKITNRNGRQSLREGR